MCFHLSHQNLLLISPTVWLLLKHEEVSIQRSVSNFQILDAALSLPLTFPKHTEPLRAHWQKQPWSDGVQSAFSGLPEQQYTNIFINQSSCSPVACQWQTRYAQRQKTPPPKKRWKWRVLVAEWCACFNSRNWKVHWTEIQEEQNTGQSEPTGQIQEATG